MITPLLALPRGFVPVTSVPMKLPCTRFPVEGLLSITTPYLPLPEMMFRAAAVVPPTVLSGALESTTPSPTLPTAWVPETSVPMKLPCTRFPDAPPFGPKMTTPNAPLPEMRLPAPAAVPPIVLLDPLGLVELLSWVIDTPCRTLPRAWCRWRRCR